MRPASATAGNGEPLPAWLHKPERIRVGARPVGKVLSVCLLAAIFQACLAPWAAAQAPPTEYQVKAAFLYNFAQFVEWPPDALADPSAPFVIGIVGEDPFESALDAVVSGRTVKGRKLVVRPLRRTDDLRACQILFVSSSARRYVPQILESLKGSSVLTVGETEGFAQTGGTVNFVMKDNLVRFEINMAATERARLKVSSRLLSLARLVGDDRHQRGS